MGASQKYMVQQQRDAFKAENKVLNAKLRQLKRLHKRSKDALKKDGGGLRESNLIDSLGHILNEG